LVYAGVLVVLGVGVGFWLLSPKQHFKDDKIDGWAKAVADLESQMGAYQASKPRQYAENLTVLRLSGCSTSPLDIWRRLEPLLRLNHPGHADFAEMQKLAGDLILLRGMFELDRKYGYGDLQGQFDELQSEIIGWRVHWETWEGRR
jgi:hypothetical protein